MISGLVRVRLDTRVPVISDVLTPQNFHQHDEHKKFFYDHFVVKGAEAAAAVQQRSTRSRVCNRRLDAQGKPQNRRGSARKSCRRSRSGNGLGGGLTIMQRSHGPRAGDQRQRVSYYRRSMGVGETPLFALHLGFTLTGAIAVGDAFTVAPTRLGRSTDDDAAQEVLMRCRRRDS